MKNKHIQLACHWLGVVCLLISFVDVIQDRYSEATFFLVLGLSFWSLPNQKR